MSFNFKKTVKQNTFLELINKKTVPTVSTDKCIAFVNPIWSTVNKKEDLDIYNQNLVLNGEEFPPEAQDGQMFVKQGIMYVFKKEKT